MTNNFAKNKIVVILGPTSAGKTGLAVKLAHELNGEIVSADSRQVYRGLDVGSGKDLNSYELRVTRLRFATTRQASDESGQEEIIKIPYHLIDVAEPNEVFDLAQYKKMAEAAIDDIISRGKLPIIAGGSGLYLQALVDDYDLSTVKPNQDLRDSLEKKSLVELQKDLQNLKPEFFAKLNNSDRNNKRRLIRYAEVLSFKSQVSSPVLKSAREGDKEWLLIGLTWPKEVLQARIKERLLERLDKEDLLGEVERLNNEGVTWRRLESFGLEYRFVAYYLQGKLDYDTMVVKLNTAINQFAKRQMTWFKRWAKQGAKITWFDAWPEQYDLIFNKIKKFLS